MSATFGNARAVSILALALGLFGAHACSGAEPRTSLIAGTPFERYDAKDSLGRIVTSYVSHPKQSSAPLLLMIQGSGCVPVLNIQAAGTYSTLFDLLPFANEGQFAVMAVEKPYSGMAAGQDPGTAAACSARFNEDFTAESWLRALQVSIDNARRLPWVDKRRTLVVGLSEGAVMAALLAGHDSRITDVVLIGGSGTTQLFDFIAGAYKRCFDVSACIGDIDRQLQAVNADPSSSTEFAWGHPYKRWASFFRIDPADELLRSRARVYIAFGTDDDATPALSEEIAVAKLKVAQRDLTVRRVPNANHMLMQSARPNMTDLDSELRAATSWFWQAPH